MVSGLLLIKIIDFTMLDKLTLSGVLIEHSIMIV